MFLANQVYVWLIVHNYLLWAPNHMFNSVTGGFGGPMHLPEQRSSLRVSHQKARHLLK